MKKLIQAYTSFSRTERMGIVALLGMLVMLLVFKASMHQWVKPDPKTVAKEIAIPGNKNTIVHLNTADSLTLISLKGIGPKAAHKILEYRRTRGNISSYDELQTIHHFPEQTLETLKENLLID